MSITARHLAKRAPRSQYFFSRSASLSSPNGDELARAHRQGLGAFVDLDAGNSAAALDQLEQGRAVLRVLPDRLVIEDDAGDVPAHGFLRAEQHLAIVAAVLFGRFHADRVETLLDGAGGFVGGKDALAGRDHGGRDPVELSQIHREVLPKRFLPLPAKIDRSRANAELTFVAGQGGRGFGTGNKVAIPGSPVCGAPE
ncbi:hypothetical protein ACVWW2_001812 [Bradyrhizobium sp. LM4.3]